MIPGRWRRGKAALAAALIAALAIAVAAAVVVSLRSNGPSDTPDAALIRTELYAGYRFGRAENVIDIGAQPVYTPAGLISGAMARDDVLREELLELGLEVRFHPFLKGRDVNSFLGAGDLEGGIGGDMPALTAAAGIGVRVTSLMQAGFTSIIAGRPMLLKELRGGRIGYAHGSNAHYALMRALSSAGVTDDQVRLVHMEVSDMAAALDRDEIRAFSAWEPFAALSVLTSDQSTVVHRSQSTGYLYLSDAFLERSPQAARQIVAAEIRAAAWIRSDRANLLRAAEWSLADAAPLWAVPRCPNGRACR